MRKKDIPKNDEANRRVLFCNNLRFMIRNGPVGRSEVAIKTGINPSTISSYMLGRTFPSEDRIKQIADALGCSVDELFDDTYAPWKFGATDK